MNDFDWLQKEILEMIGESERGIPPGNILFHLSRHDHYRYVRPTWVKLKGETRDEMVVSATLKLVQRGLIGFVVEHSHIGQLGGPDDLSTDVVKVRKIRLLDRLAAL